MPKSFAARVLSFTRCAASFASRSVGNLYVGRLLPRWCYNFDFAIGTTYDPENADTHERAIRDKFSRQAVGFAAAPELHTDEVVALIGRRGGKPPTTQRTQAVSPFSGGFKFLRSGRGP